MLRNALSVTKEEPKLNLQQKSKMEIYEYFEEGLEVSVYKPQMTEEQRIKKDIEIRKNIADIVSKSV